MSENQFEIFSISQQWLKIKHQFTHLNVFLYNRLDFIIEQMLHILSHQFHWLLSGFKFSLIHRTASIVSTTQLLQHNFAQFTVLQFLWERNKKISTAWVFNKRRRIFSDSFVLTFTLDAVPLDVDCEFWLEVIELVIICHELLESSDDDMCWSGKLSIDWFVFITMLLSHRTLLISFGNSQNTLIKHN